MTRFEIASLRVQNDFSQNLAKIHPFISPFALIKKLSISQPQISNSSCVYHRLDLLPPQLQSKLCRHFDFPATLETGSVFLSPKAFLKPYRYTSQNMTEETEFEKWNE